MQNITKVKKTNSRLFYILIAIAVLINACGLFCSISNGDDNLYSVIAKHIVLSHNWIDLTYANHAWLDKPHLPFWLTAVSYEIFGFNAFAYMFPGFLFSLIGACYTYRLTKKIYSHEIALLAVLIYLSSLCLMLGSTDVEAEAYLLGEIIPACYYWLCYDTKNSTSYLLKGAIFTALAMMTKGIFVILPIFSGIGAMWIAQFGFAKAMRNVFSLKWILALLLSLVFIAPELISLYLQFDMHPNLVVFGQTHVSGIQFFFWGSQFGRFFDNGPITKNVFAHHLDLAHYFYYVNVMFWAFLPWILLFIAALFRMKRQWRLSVNSSINYIYLLGSFFPTFIVFSITRFQFDHYVNILIPFAAIIVADYLYHAINNQSCNKMIGLTQRFVALLLSLVAIIFSLKILRAWPADAVAVPTIFIQKWIFIIIAITGVITAGYALLTFKNRSLQSALIISVVSSCMAFAFVTNATEMVCRVYNQGYVINQYLNDKPKHLVVDYQVGSLNLEFLTKNNYARTNSIDNILKITQKQTSYYLVADEKQWADLKSHLLIAYKSNNLAVPNIKLIHTFRTIHSSIFQHIVGVLISSQVREASVDRRVVALVTERT